MLPDTNLADLSMSRQRKHGYIHESTATCSCPNMYQPVLQVFMLLPDMDSGAVWREVALLRNCAHRRIVPLYGVAIKVPIVDCCLLSLPCLPVQLWVAMWLIVAECLL